VDEVYEWVAWLRDGRVWRSEERGSPLCLRGEDVRVLALIPIAPGWPPAELVAEPGEEVEVFATRQATGGGPVTTLAVALGVVGGRRVWLTGGDGGVVVGGSSLEAIEETAAWQDGCVAAAREEAA